MEFGYSNVWSYGKTESLPPVADQTATTDAASKTKPLYPEDAATSARNQTMRMSSYVDPLHPSKFPYLYQENPSGRPFLMGEYQNIYGINPYSLPASKYSSFYEPNQYSHGVNDRTDSQFPSSMVAQDMSHNYLSNNYSLSQSANGKISHQNEMLFSTLNAYPELRPMINGNSQDGKSVVSSQEKRPQDGEHVSNFPEKRKQDDQSANTPDTSSVAKRKKSNVNQQDIHASTLLLNLLQDSPDGDNSDAEKDDDDGNDTNGEYDED